jgi:hypothetical protein
MNILLDRVSNLKSQLSPHVGAVKVIFSWVASLLPDQCESFVCPVLPYVRGFTFMSLCKEPSKAPLIT